MKQNLGKTLKRLRVAQGLTQEQLAYKSGVTKDYLAKIERGKVQDPGFNLIASIATALDESVDVFRQERATEGTQPVETDI